MPLSGMWRRVGVVRTVVSEESVASIFRGKNTRAGRELYICFSLIYFSTLKIEAICSSETSVLTTSTLRHMLQDGILHSHRRENLKFCM
jgi:hypothetical protein